MSAAMARLIMTLGLVSGLIWLLVMGIAHVMPDLSLDMGSCVAKYGNIEFCEDLLYS